MLLFCGGSVCLFIVVYLFIYLRYLFILLDLKKPIVYGTFIRNRRRS